MTSPWDDYLERIRGHEAAQLRWHWEESYRVGWNGEFFATRLDNGVTLRAEAAEDLRDLIIADYCEHPVPRQPSTDLD